MTDTTSVTALTVVRDGVTKYYLAGRRRTPKVFDLCKSIALRNDCFLTVVKRGAVYHYSQLTVVTGWNKPDGLRFAFHMKHSRLGQSRPEGTPRGSFYAEAR